ncbi:Dilute domain-containing protein C25B8.08 [Apiospora aurea]|uniref:Dilute domain-containing protein C25B8.08 n=1 Tax=Apiospora aurea TaxID=335848 RepID=A0ABR1Q6V4_9PEZI
MLEDIEYRLESVQATSVASDKIDETFRSTCIDLISGTLGGKVLGFSDEWFAEANNLVTPTAPIRQPGKMVYTGAWYDGWETRRHNQEPFDWVVIRLGVASGTVEGVEVDTAFFSGNHAPAISVEGCFSQDDNEVLSWKGGKGKWDTILDARECGPSQRFGWRLDAPTSKQFRLFGHAVPVFPEDKEAVFDLGAAQNGAVAVSCSDQHFGTKDNLVLPGRGKDMGDGWETARSRSKGHVDWAIIRLGAPALIQSFIVDTAYFRGNFPQKAKLDTIEWTGQGDPGADADGWTEVVEPSKCGPDQEHAFGCLVTDRPFTHVKLTIIPDGGVKRLRVLAKRHRGFADEPRRTRELPPDLPKSLNDRIIPKEAVAETEYYDGWQGQSQFLTSPILAKPLQFSDLTLEDTDYDPDVTKAMPDSDTRLMEMLAAQAQHHGGEGLVDPDEIANDEKRSTTEKENILQKSLAMAASNGDLVQVKRILGGDAKKYVNGHETVVQALVDAGVDVDKQDRNQWSALMWAMTNRHKSIAKILLDNGASADAKTSSGRTAFDFVPPDSEMSFYLHDNGYSIGNAGVTDDFYNPGFEQDRFEEELAENEMRRRMMMESARDLEVDLGNVGMDDQPEGSDDYEEEAQEFDWSRCLHDQMFVFQESDLERILDIIITNMQPQRSPSQKPVPANMIFLSARYAHYHASSELLEKLLISAQDKINEVVEKHQWDMTILAFWMSNATLLLHYLKKDAGLVEATTEFQAQLAELINEIFILVVRDAERRMDKVLEPAMLDHETIPGFEDVTFQHEWKIFKRKKEVKQEPIEKRYRPPSPKARAKPAPRNVTSLMSSTLFVLDLYDIHSVITSQIISQLLYWLGAELFNHIMDNRKFLARTKAMQIRMNISVIEDWARANNRKPEHYEHGDTTATGETTMDAARRHLAPVVQLLQWLQCFSSLEPDNLEALVGTLQQLKRLSPQQLLFSAKYYRPEVGEKGLPKSAVKYLEAMQKEVDVKRDRRRTISPVRGSVPSTPIKNTSNGFDIETPGSAPNPEIEEYEMPEGINFDPSLMLPFSLPSAMDMRFLEKLELSGQRERPMFGEKDWENEEV